MSTHIPRCDDCGRDRVFERCAPLGDGNEASYGVSWRCPEGHGLALDICPIGPLVPTDATCVNCGTPYDAPDAAKGCTGCGLTFEQCPAALGHTEETTAEPIANAQQLFGQGL